MKYIYRPGRIRRIIEGFVLILEGLVLILTLGHFFRTSLIFKFVAWAESKCMEERRANEKTI